MRGLKDAVGLFRVKEWYDSKVPMLLLPLLYGAALAADRFSPELFGKILLILYFDSIFLAFGYLINDYADMDVDKKAGKDKRMHHLPAGIPLFLVIGSIVLGCLPVLIVSPDWRTVLALAVIYFFGGSYSAPPLRFKERGVWGLLVSSSAQRCFPLFLLPVLMKTEVDAAYLLWILLSFFVGLRYILVHQYVDAENDRKAGVETFALHHQRKVAVLIRLSFAAELAFLTLLMIPAAVLRPWILWFLAAYALLTAIRWRGCRMVFGQGGLYSFDQVPLEDLYNHFLPLLFAVMMMQSDPGWGILPAIWAAALLYPAVGHLKFPARIIADYVKRKSGRSYEG